jgi:type II secretory pathway predicted ATPase ExeA
MDSKPARTIDDAPSEHEAVGPDQFIRISAGKIIATVVDAVMRGEAYVVLTGPAGSGKTIAATAIRDELVGRSVQVRSVGRGHADRLRLRDIAAQLLGRPKETLTEVIASFDEIAGLFEAMAAESRSVLIIDDAEVLQPSALEYLCEMASMSTPARPQFVFVGRPEFWEVTNRTAPAQFKNRITARWELGRLSSDTACAFIERLVASQGQSTRDVFDTGGLAALMQKSDGLFGRIVALLTRARAIQAAQGMPRVTSDVIEAAAALDGEETTALDYGGASANSAAVHTTTAAESDPVPESALALAPAPPALPDPAGEPFGGAGTVARWGIPAWPGDRAPPESPNGPLSLRRRSYAYALGLVLVLSAAGTLAYRGIPAGSYRTATPATELDAPASVASPAQSATSGAVAPSQQGTTPAQADIEAAVTNQSQVSLSEDAPAAAAQPESGQPTANVANRSAAVVPRAGASTADNAPEQSAPHGTAPDVTVAAVAMPSAQRAAQAGTPSAAPSPAVPTQGQLMAASAATPVELPSPQAAMPPAAPLPAVPTQGQVAAASAATPVEPPSPQAAMPPAAPLPAVPTQGSVAASTATPTEPQAPQAVMPPPAPLPALPTQGPAAALAAMLTEPQAPQTAMPPAAPLPAVPMQGPVTASTATLTEPPSPQAATPPAAPLPAVPTQGSAAASTATLTEPPSPQAATPPAARLPAAPTQGSVAASTATPTEPQAPQADMPPAAPPPAVPTQGQVAASTSMPTEPQTPQAAMPPAAPLPAVPTQGPALASTATLTESPSPQAAMPPAAPLPAAPTQGSVAASTATLTEPSSPQAAMPPAAPLPAVPTQGSVAASTATLTEPPSPQAATPPAASLPAAQTPEAAAAAATTPDAPRAPQAAMPSAAPAQQQATAEPAMAEFYAARGDHMLEIRDLSAARRFYETAANAGSGRAAMALGRTYDPAFLSQMQVIGLRPDPVVAATWYRRAAELGVPKAAATLRALTTDADR